MTVHPEPPTKYPPQHEKAHIITPPPPESAYKLHNFGSRLRARLRSDRKIIEQFNIRKCILMTTPGSPATLPIDFSLLIKNFVRAYDTPISLLWDFFFVYSALVFRDPGCVMV